MTMTRRSLSGWAAACTVSLGVVSALGIRGWAATSQPVLFNVPATLWLARGGPLVLFWQNMASRRIADFEASLDGRNWTTGPLQLRAVAGHTILRIRPIGGPEMRFPMDVRIVEQTYRGGKRAPKILGLGDSLQEQSIPTALQQDLKARGMAPTMLGTTVSSAWHGVTVNTEGRGGKRITDFIYERVFDPANPYTMGPLPSGREDFYRGLPAGYALGATRKQYNPFLRPANGASFRGDIRGAVLTTTAILSGFVGTGQMLAGAGVAPGTTIVRPIAGRYGGIGQYLISIPQHVRAQIMTSDENRDYVRNGYLFDMCYYLRRFAEPDPDIVLLSLGTNDMFGFLPNIGQAEMSRRLRPGLDILHAQIRAAAPQAKVIIYNVAWGKDPKFERQLENHRALMMMSRDYVARARDPNLFWLPVAPFQQEDASWGVHPVDRNIEIEAAVIGSFIAALV